MNIDGMIHDGHSRRGLGSQAQGELKPALLGEHATIT